MYDVSCVVRTRDVFSGARRSINEDVDDGHLLTHTAITNGADGGTRARKTLLSHHGQARVGGEDGPALSRNVYGGSVLSMTFAIRGREVPDLDQGYFMNGCLPHFDGNLGVFPDKENEVLGHAYQSTVGMKSRGRIGVRDSEIRVEHRDESWAIIVLQAMEWGSRATRSIRSNMEPLYSAGMVPL
ncbi:hypothetical protein B0H19DRAFT_1059974 [Mycena capillaripes]|nr:hypothetical protein B0H19DRAFT_1059974 [Mycena capillaripes]